MSAMQSPQGDDQKGIPAPAGCFLMWHDYMNLHKTLSQMLKRRDTGQAVAGNVMAAEGSITLRPQRLDRGSAGSSSNSSASLGTSCNNSSASSNRDLRNTRDSCGFCKQNGEAAEIYMTHRLKARDGRITCPILRNYVCPFCSATGDWAHTRQYCPLRNRSRSSIDRHINGH